ncbi:hypothetical protein SAMN04488105_105319 [Salipiger thiooxidans]|uniref:Response regulatory domain-containing protein n=1 Tax=Salipiger thiooxidans TaxID=282683 RepID=A0A1G7EF03_9RHOB|nr:hypothetical protein [Salipiger thiooxidans]SDE62240.1 hypothetical protein SAMN04488105_105319 [Salipiger thiooxidans]
MTLNDRMFPALSFLVFVHDPVVAEDIASTLEESHPGARIVLPANEAAALAALDEHPQITLAVMSMSPEAAQASALGSALAARQARVVLMGFEAEERGESAGFTVLHRPFRTADLLAMLANPAR